jgi:hypothetical protein
VIGKRGASVLLGLTALVVAACGSSNGDSDVDAPACGGTSPANLIAEQTPSGTCPAVPTTLTGGQTGGQSCTDTTDCKPQCCSCPGTGGGAAVAECANGNCVYGDTVCCLYAEQCQ